MPGDLDLFASFGIVQEAKNRRLCVSSSHLFRHMDSIAVSYAMNTSKYS